MKFLMFTMNSTKYLIEINKVHSIIKKSSKDVNSIPDSPSWILGLTSLRDKIMLIIDFRKRLNIHTKDENEYNVIVVNSKNEIAGIVVDEVNGVISSDEKITIPNNVLNVEYIKGLMLINDDIHVVVDTDKIFDFDIKKFV